jgi:hypothetical protein
LFGSHAFPGEGGNPSGCLGTAHAGATAGSLRQLEQTVASSGSSSAQCGQTFTPKSFRRPAAVAVALGVLCSATDDSCRIIVPCLMLPDLERADRIGEFWGYPESRAFAELLIDCEEDRTLRAVLVGMLREADRKES